MAVCPFPHSTDRFDPLDLQNPFPILARARREVPVFYDPELDYWIVTRYEDIKAIFQDHDRFTAANTISPIVPFSEEVQTMLREGNYTPVPVLSNNVPPDHTRVRKLVNKLFVPRRMAHFEPAIREMVDRRIDELLPLGRADFVEQFAYDLPAMVLFLVCGVPDEDVPQVKIWAGNRIKLYYGRPTPAEQIELTQYLVPFWHYVVDLVTSRLEEPTDDLIGDLIKMRQGDDQIISVNEIASVMITLLVAGHETTTSQLTNGMMHFLEQRAPWEQLCAEPELIPAAVEEMMRFDPSVCTWRRFSVEESKIGEVEIPKNANLLLMLNSANRDDGVFEEPETIDFQRNNLKDHLALGYGIHYCVGAPLARLEMKIMLERLTSRMPSLRLVPEQTPAYVPNISFRGPLQLDVTWGERPA